ncbi:Ubiquitin carboxyl-terminal hydrolase-related protein [Hirschfeldia incana]|nr:Ubiquitin carboxyl-terminal hydrolase-related protein [Hirschfeldia incana]
MESSPFKDDEEAAVLFFDAQDHIAKGEHSKALEILDDLLLFYAQEEGSGGLLHCEQARIFSKLSRAEAKSPNLSFTYLLASVACYSLDVNLSRLCAEGLHDLANRLGSVLYYKECVRIGKQALYLSHRDNNAAQNDLLRDLEEQRRRGLELMVKDSEFWIFESKTKSIRSDETKFVEPERSPEPVRGDVNKGLRLFWDGLDVKIKRELMKVSIEKLRGFVHNSEGSLEALEKVLAYAKEHKKWTTWVCRTICLADFTSAKECKTHLEQQHAADFKPELEKDVVIRLGRKWANKIQGGDWEPVDTAAAVVMIKTQLEDVKKFTLESRKKGWSNRWPLVTDEERRGLLQAVKLLLVSLCERQILSCSIRDWVMRFPVKHLRKLEVSDESINDCHIVETPESICFLERYELSQIRAFLETIKCERHDGTNQVCRAADSLLDRIRIKETIELDEKFSLLLLDKRLLKSNNAAPFDGDDDGKIKFIKDPDVHYAKAHAQGDDIISWLGDCSSVDKSFPRPIREHNLEIWVAVLRAVQYTCRTLRTKYEKKENLLQYKAAVTFVENLCNLEDERRKIVPEDQKISYASLLCDRCEERLPKEKKSLTARLFLCAVRDVFGGGWAPTFDLEDCMSRIREGKGLRDEIVLKYTELLKSAVTEKVLQIDAKILLIDNSRIRLLDKLTMLSAFDNRSYMLQLIKPFLLNEIVNMESKAKSDAAEAAEADLLLEEEKMSQAKEKKKTKRTKITSTSMASPVDKTVEVEPSVKLEPEEDKEPEGDQLETSSNTDIQVEATKVDRDDMKNMSREDSLPKHLESSLEGAAARYDSALDMTLKNKIVNMGPKAKSDAADLLPKEEKTSHAKKKKRTRRTKKTSTSMVSPLEQKPSVVTSQSPKTMEEDSMEPKDTLGSEKGPLEISSTNDIQEEATKVNSGDIQNMPGEDSVSGNLESAPGGAAARYNSALDMTLKALVNINILKEQVLKYNKQPVHDNLEEQVLCALQNLVSAVVSQKIKTVGVYRLILRDLLVSLEEVNSMLGGTAEVLVTILASWHCWKNSELESLVTRLFTLEENERMSCRKCGRTPNYSDQSSYGIVMAADSIRNIKCAFGDIKFVDILKVTRLNYKMLCDIETGGCGTTNFVHHVISRCPPIFIIVLEWEKSETEKEISETTEALEWEIDISRLYEGLEPNTNYRLVSMVGYGEEDKEHICMAYEQNRWINLRRESLAGEVVGSWKSVVRFCGERKIRPEILFFELQRSMMT